MPDHIVLFDETPPGGWQYTDPDTGQNFSEMVYGDLVRKVAQSRESNNLDTVNLHELVDAYNVKRVPARFVGGRENGSASRLSFNRVLNGTKAVIQWHMDGREREDAGLVAWRKGICAACPHNVDWQGGCAGCLEKTLHSLVRSFTGSERDHALKVCDVCGCDLSAKIHMNKEFLRKRMTPEQVQTLPPFCWLL